MRLPEASAAATVTAARLARLVAAAGPLERPAYRSLATAIRTIAVDGRLPSRVRLPGERDLAQALDLSRTTITRAYAELVGEGWASSRQGSGTVLALPGRVPHAASPLVPRPDVEVDLTAAAVRCAPGTAALVERALEGLPGLLRGPGYEPVGLPALREEIAAGYRARGLPTTAEQIVVTAGALAGLAVVARAVVRRGDRALVEAPTYPSAVAALRAAGARLDAVRVDAVHGWDLEAYRDAARRAAPAVAYLVPERHNPTGHTLAAAARAELASTLSASTLVVDESLLLLELDGDVPPPPLAAFHPTTFSLGSVSKPLWGGVRVGWIRCPTAAVTAVRSARLTLDLGPSVLDQLVALEFLRSPQEVLDGRRTALRQAREEWLAALPSTWRAERPRGGLGLWVGLPERWAPELAAAALEDGIAIAAGPQFDVEGASRDRLRIPLTSEIDDVPAVVARLERARDLVTERMVGGSSDATSADPRHRKSGARAGAGATGLLKEPTDYPLIA